MDLDAHMHAQPVDERSLCSNIILERTSHTQTICLLRKETDMLYKTAITSVKISPDHIFPEIKPKGQHDPPPTAAEARLRLIAVPIPPTSPSA